MFERELDYYGVAIEEDSITAETVPAYLESLTSAYRLAKKEQEAAKEKQDAFLLAMESHRQFHLKQSGSVGTAVEIRIGTQDDLYKKHYSFHGGSGKAIFDEYLGKFFDLEISPRSDVYHPPNLTNLPFYVRKKT